MYRYLWVKITAGLRLGASEQSDAVVVLFAPWSAALPQVLPVLQGQQVVTHPALNKKHPLVLFGVGGHVSTICLCISDWFFFTFSIFLLTDDHLEALGVVLDEGLSLYCLGEEGFGDQRKADTPQHLHHVLLSVAHVVLQPANCSVVNLKTNKTLKRSKSTSQDLQ